MQMFLYVAMIVKIAAIQKVILNFVLNAFVLKQVNKRSIVINLI